MQIGDKIIVQMPRYIAVLYVSELQSLLSLDKNLWELAIRRGKSEARFQKEEERRGK